MKGCSSAVLLNTPPPPPPPPYTDSYQIFHCVWMKGCSSAVLLNTPPPPPPPPPYTDSYQIFHCVWMKGCSSAFLHIVCVFDQSVLCLSALQLAAQAHTHTLQPGEQRLSCGLYFQRFILKHVQQFSNCKDGILQQSTDDWSDSDV